MQSRRCRGFTLSELMVAVALVGILSTLSIVQLRSRRLAKAIQDPKMREYLQYPAVVQSHLALLRHWVNPPSEFGGRPRLPASTQAFQATAQDIAAVAGIPANRVSLMTYSGDGSAIVAGGLVVFDGLKPAGILFNNGSWLTLPQEHFEVARSPQEPTRYFKSLSYVAVWRKAQSEKIVTIFSDVEGDGKRFDIKEKFYFLVDGVEWPSQLTRFRDFTRIDGLRGQVTEPGGSNLVFNGKIPRYFPDSGAMPTFKLMSLVGGDPVIALYCNFCG